MTSIKKQPKKKRSNAYPSIDLEEAINLTKKLREGLGKGPYSREAVAIALGYSGVNGLSASKIAALVHFGLLSRSGSSYSQSELADRILKPEFKEDEQIAILESLKSPKLYKALFDKFSGQSLPAMLSNILYRSFGIRENVSGAVTKSFKKSIGFAGVFKDGILLDNFQSDSKEDVIKLKTQGVKDQSQISDSKEISSNTDKYTVYLPSGIVILFPVGMRYDVSLGKFVKSFKSLESVAKKIDTK